MKNKVTFLSIQFFLFSSVFYIWKIVWTVSNKNNDLLFCQKFKLDTGMSERNSNSILDRQKFCLQNERTLQKNNSNG